MILQYGEPDFDPAWLSYVQNDPVHPNLPVEKRIDGPRTLFAFVREGQPLYLISAFIGTSLARTVNDILEARATPISYRLGSVCAVFYSIFRTADSIKGAGGQAIYEVIDYCKKQGIVEFFTLSPVPCLTNHFLTLPDLPTLATYLMSRQDAVARFHLNNGANLHAINYGADTSLVRKEESWGVMVNYRYPDQLPVVESPA